MKHYPIVLDPPQIISDVSTFRAVTSQCDACADIVFVRDEKLACPGFGESYKRQPQLIEQKITDQYDAVLSPYSGSLAVLNVSAQLCLQHFQAPQPFHSMPAEWFDTWGETQLQEVFTKMISHGLLAAKHASVVSFTEDTNQLSAWLHLTDRCNLRCSYCYLPHKSADMSIETGRDAIAATFRSAQYHNYKQVKFKYAGGEPLLKFDLIKALHQHAHVLSEQQEIGLDGVVLSNGTCLTQPIIAAMRDLKLRLMISMDGLGHVHDRQRPYANGRNSSEDVLGAIELALEHGVVPDISITVTGRNSEGLADLVAWVLDRNLPFALNFYRENDHSLSHADLRLEEEKIITGMLAAYRAIEANLPTHSLLNAIIDRADLSSAHLRTCSVGHSYLVFDYLGQISKCQMQNDKPITTAHSIDPLSIIRADKVGIQNVSVEEKEGCRTCEWKYWCAGGCPLETFRATGRYDVKSPNCGIYKALYPELIRLEGQRLLKYFNN